MAQITATTFISQLTKPMQETIKQDILSFYTVAGINPYEKDELGNTNIEVALGGRICDIEENVDTSIYLK